MPDPSAKRGVDRVPVVPEELRGATIDVLRERGFDGLILERVAEVAGRARSTLGARASTATC